MEKLKMLDSRCCETTANKDDTVLHEAILDILFKYKKEIHRKLIDLKGMFLIDHIAIIIIDPNKKMLIFSITPSVEYNLILQGLWKHDNSFSIDFQKTHHFYKWDEAYSENYFNEIKFIKEIKHGFTFGFNLSKKLGEFNLIYAFGTRSTNTNLIDYYRCYKNEIYGLGDYGFKLIYDIYSNYCDIDIPLMNNHQNYYYKKPILKLLINNK